MGNSQKLDFTSLNLKYTWLSVPIMFNYVKRAAVIDNHVPFLLCHRLLCPCTKWSFIVLLCQGPVYIGLRLSRYPTKSCWRYLSSYLIVLVFLAFCFSSFVILSVFFCGVFVSLSLSLFVSFASRQWPVRWFVVMRLDSRLFPHSNTRKHLYLSQWERAW